MSKAIGYLVDTERGPQYVATLPGPESGWGFVRTRAQALPLTPYWQRRFEGLCRNRKPATTALFIALHVKGPCYVFA